MMRNDYVEQLNRELKEETEYCLEEAKAMRKRPPKPAPFKRAAGYAACILGFIFLIAFREPMGWFRALLFGAVVGTVLTVLVYLLVSAYRNAYNKRIENACRSEIEACRQDTDERIRRFQEDVSLRCVDRLEQYNQGSKKNPIYTWMDSLWKLAITNALKQSYLTELTPGVSYEVSPTMISAKLRLNEGSRWQYPRELCENYPELLDGESKANCPVGMFVFKENGLGPLCSGEDPYETAVETAAYAKFLYIKYTWDLTGSEEAPFAYAPNQTIRDANTRAKLELEESDCVFPGNSYEIRYRAANPAFKQLIDMT